MCSSEMELQIRVVKTGARLANPVTLTLTPMNVTQAQTAGISTANIPDDNSHQPNRARSKLTTKLECQTFLILCNRI